MVRVVLEEGMVCERPRSVSTIDKIGEEVGVHLLQLGLHVVMTLSAVSWDHDITGLFFFTSLYIMSLTRYYLPEIMFAVRCWQVGKAVYSELYEDNAGRIRKKWIHVS